MTSLDDDQARQIAEQLIYDIEHAVDIDEACNIYTMVMSSGRDALAVGLHLSRTRFGGSDEAIATRPRSDSS